VAAAVEGALRGAAGIACSLAPRATHVDEAIAFAAAVVRAAVGDQSLRQMLTRYRPICC
jgi:broad specificity polyphosphatase/5'/3'-nucleotidase SurE